LNVDDLVLQSIQNTKYMHKLSTPWEGTFIVKKVIGPATYRLQWADGQGVPKDWNIEHLCRFYPLKICTKIKSSVYSPFVIYSK
jgi:hypothetical protein